MQVHGYPRVASDVRQHPGVSQQTAAAVPPASQSHAGYRSRDERLDRRVSVSVPEPPLELQHHGAGTQRVRAASFA